MVCQQLVTLHATCFLCLQVMRSKDMPGAGQYNTYRAVGKQPLSSKKTLPAHSFGKSTRDASKKVSAADMCSRGTRDLLPAVGHNSKVGDIH